MLIYVQENSITPEGLKGPRSYMNAKRYVELYWRENLWPLLKNGKHGDAIGENR